jgi:alkanesulfonate monooxygenase SsuD/methylene tetrahydromethanopterin reductase-like flavin-dependent oxidoreductase (luciferase family)
MEIGLGLGGELNLSLAEQAELAKEAATLGYSSVWTNEGTGLDGFHACAQRWAATKQVVEGGLTTGISVSPVMYRTPMGFAMSAGTLTALTEGRFILGIGTGGAYRPESRRALGFPDASALSVMRDYLTTTRGLLAGEEVNYQGKAVTLRGARLGITPPPGTPVYVAAMGPQMLQLAGELADGVCLNWCTTEHVTWSRERVEGGANKAGRSRTPIPLLSYIRVCIDDDVDVARLAFARALMGYALGRSVPTDQERSQGYRAHFERMGYAEPLAKLDRMRSTGASQEKVAEAFPDGMLRQLGYYGPANGAAESFQRVAQGLDVAIVRVVPSKPGLDAIRSVMAACAPGRSTG